MESREEIAVIRREGKGRKRKEREDGGTERRSFVLGTFATRSTS